MGKSGRGSDDGDRGGYSNTGSIDNDGSSGNSNGSDRKDAAAAVKDGNAAGVSESGVGARERVWKYRQDSSPSALPSISPQVVGLSGPTATSAAEGSGLSPSASPSAWASSAPWTYSALWWPSRRPRRRRWMRQTP